MSKNVKNTSIKNNDMKSNEVKNNGVKNNSIKNNGTKNEILRNTASKSSSKGNQYKSRGGKVIEPKQNRAYLVPIAFLLGMFPLIIYQKIYKVPLSEFSWFSASDNYVDFFLYYKSRIFLFLALVMLLVLAYRRTKDNRIFRYDASFLPLILYAALAVLSSVVSQYRSISFRGGYEHFESVFVLVGYCVVAYYVSVFIKSEEDVSFVLKGLLFCAIIFTLLGLSQTTGHDFLTTDAGKRLIMPSMYWNNLDSLEFNFDQWVYLTLYNPNYVGSYVALVAPVILVLAFKKWKSKEFFLYMIALAGLIVCLIYSNSDTGLIACFITAIFGLILARKHLLKHIRIYLPVLLVAIVMLVAVNAVTHNEILSKITNQLKLEKTQYNLTEIQTNEDEVRIEYKENILQVRFLLAENESSVVLLTDGNGSEVPADYNAEEGSYILQDDRFPGFAVTPSYYNNMVCFQVNIDGKDWLFTNQTDGSYYYINRYGKLDKIISAPSIGFEGYESFATQRGFIWSKTLPLLKKHIFLGSGADTFVIEFPQQDYVALDNNGYTGQIITKPHNLYLQMGVQTGVLSLIAFLMFYGMYFISSLRLYWKGRFDSFYSQVGVGILVGTFGYMITGLANDSTITVAPVYWVLMGMGIAVNRKVKQQVQEEKPVMQAAPELKTSPEMQASERHAAVQRKNGNKNKKAK